MNVSQSTRLPLSLLGLCDPVPSVAPMRTYYCRDMQMVLPICIEPLSMSRIDAQRLDLIRRPTLVDTVLDLLAARQERITGVNIDAIENGIVLTTVEGDGDFSMDLRFSDAMTLVVGATAETGEAIPMTVNRNVMEEWGVSVSAPHTVEYLMAGFIGPVIPETVQAFKEMCAAVDLDFDEAARDTPFDDVPDAEEGDDDDDFDEIFRQALEDKQERDEQERKRRGRMRDTDEDDGESE